MTLGVNLFVVVAAVVAVQNSEATVLQVAHSLIRNNLAGSPENFQTTKWEFDPEVGYHWQKEYRQLNGIRAEGLIERLGLGEDTFTEQRRVQQAIRDRGVQVSRQPVNGP